MNVQIDKSASEADVRYMRRALLLAAYGAGRVSPNPMVGAVVVARGRIIGEGWHRRFGEGHAEVNALASVAPADRPLLPEATVYVTLEPCSHYGKTPPCARLLIERGVRRVVTGAGDPNPLVSGRGIRMLREAGIEVTEGVLADECEVINCRFMTSQRLRRPWIQLKWACSADGYMAGIGTDGRPRTEKFSTPLTAVWMHRERAMADAIMVGSRTVEIDNPRLNLRLWPGRDPLKVYFPSPRIAEDSHIRQAPSLELDRSLSLRENMRILFEKHGVGSLMVEGGAALLESFIREGLYDEIRVEKTSRMLGEGLHAPAIPAGLTEVCRTESDGNQITVWRHAKRAAEVLSENSPESI